MTPDEIEFTRKQLLERVAGEDQLCLKVIEALPADRIDWNPGHEKCMTAGGLAAHMVGAGEFFLGMAEGDPPPDAPPAPPTTKDELVASVTAVQERFRTRLAEMTTEQLAGKRGFVGQEFGVLEILSWHALHMVHHRGQLVLYLRLMGAHVPATYGPSGDEHDFTDA